MATEWVILPLVLGAWLLSLWFAYGLGRRGELRRMLEERRRMADQVRDYLVRVDATIAELDDHDPDGGRRGD